MKIKGINSRHSKLLVKYVNFIQGLVYEATEFSGTEKFASFNEVLHNSIQYSNTFKKIMKTPNTERDWVYLAPNLMLYSCLGFFAGIKNKHNKHLIESLSEELLEKTIEFLGCTSDILEAIAKEKDVKERIKVIQKQQNEPNN
tara:strand:- start:381 stop:809 length:429 start_codon:yes stop_codon:yes gene_type:complete